MLYKMIQSFTIRKPFIKDFKLLNQVKSSSGSAMDNITEGFERGGNKEFIQFLYKSKGFAGETRSQLYRALDSDYINEEEFNATYHLAEEVSKLNSSLINHLNSSGIKGTKYK